VKPSHLHTDPTPGAFIHDDDTGVTGLIDWAGSCRGPALYDVASAVMYLGGPDLSERFLTAYVDRGPLKQTELRQLDTFRRFRWAIQASYFASRIVADDRTGIADDPAHNQAALDRARRGLEETRPPTRV
jgi:Ser/Thr protein kinase RdoA (MazF antagonist)